MKDGITMEVMSNAKNNTAYLKRKKYNIWPYLFLLPFFALYTAFFAYPTLYSFYISLTDWDGVAGINKMKFVGLANYIRLFTRDTLFYKSLFNTLLFMVLYIPVVIFGGLVLAVLLYKLKSNRRLFQTLNVLPYITTPAAIGVIFAFMFDWSTGIINKILVASGLVQEGINWLGIGSTARFVVILMLIWKNFGYYLIIYLAGLSTIPEELTEAALVDGANERQIFFKITTPYLRPITQFLIITSITGGLQLFDEPMVLFGGSGGGPFLIGGPDRSCLTGMIYFYDRAFKSTTFLGYGAAITYGIFIFIVLLSFISSRLLYREEER
jgi:multiple sugar transport system permease protein/cellobiose transport system permease protein